MFGRALFLSMAVPLAGRSAAVVPVVLRFGRADVDHCDAVSQAVPQPRLTVTYTAGLVSPICLGPVGFGSVLGRGMSCGAGGTGAAS